MLKFYPLKVKEIKKETPDCVSIVLEVPEALQGDFAYQQGQYLTLKTQINGEEVRRSYSLCSSPLDKEWRVAVKHSPGGKFSTYANTTLVAGDSLEVAPPEGRFFEPLHQGQGKLYVFFAAGSGITPILSNIKTILRAEPLSKVVLYYGNSRVDTIIFHEELQGLKNLYLTRFSIHFLLSREKQEEDCLNGRLDAQSMNHLIAKTIHLLQVDCFFLCGPEEMIFELRHWLVDHGIPEKKIHLELFASNRASKAATVHTVTAAGGCKATVKADGRTLEFIIPENSNRPLLDAALPYFPNLPFACKGGVCCTCKARLLSGEVNMAVNYGLDESEIAQGYVLTCQAFPVTAEIIIDFDV